MKTYTHVIIILFSLLLISCAAKEDWYLEEVSPSNGEVKLRLKREMNLPHPIYKNKNTSLEDLRDSLSILIPIEYKLNFNKDNLTHLTIIPIIKQNSSIYELYDPKQKKTYYELTRNTITNYEYGNNLEHGYKDYPKRIYIYNLNLYISKAEAQKYLNFYKVKKNLNDLQEFSDEIEITSYKQFRKDFPEFVEKLNKIPDSIYFKIYMMSKASLPDTTITKRIHW